MQDSKGPGTALPVDFQTSPQMKSLYSFVLTLISAVFLILSYDPFNFYGLAWISFVPFLLAIRARKDKSVFWLGTLLGFVFLLGSLFWLRTIHWSVPFLLALLWSPLWGLWAWITKKMWFYLCFPDVETSTADAQKREFSLSWKKYLILILCSSCMWVFFEWLRFWLFSGFPWNLLGISQAYFTPALPVASLFGVLGISLLIIINNLSIAMFLEAYSLSKKFRWQIIPIPLFLLIFSFVLGKIPKDQMSAPYTLNVLLVQGNFYPITDREVSQEDYLEQIQTYRNLSLKHAVDKPDLIIWPETPIISKYTEDPFFQKTIKDVARLCQSKILFGSIHKENDRSTNAAFFVDRNGELINRYDKIHLVPYGEYTPMKSILPSSIWNWLNGIVNMGNLDTGTSYDVMQVSKNFRAGVNICFEDVFPKNSREYIRSGANILITLTNDSWYEQTAGGAQHTAHSVFRAVENDLPLLRCGTNSESCYITPEGKITHLIKDENGSRFARGTAMIKVSIGASPRTTFYYRNPNLLIILCSGIAFLAFLATALHFLKRKSRLRGIISGRD